jgi:hypothetical protein
MEVAPTGSPKRWNPTSKPWQNTAVPPTPTARRERLRQFLEKASPAVVGAPEWAELNQLLAPITDSYLRRLLRESGVRLAPIIEGVRQSDFDELERTLTALAEIYAAGDLATARECRRLVIEARQHARWAQRRAGADEARRRTKAEMQQWMLVWLENPEVFPAWASLRRKNW